MRPRKNLGHGELRLVVLYNDNEPDAGELERLARSVL